MSMTITDDVNTGQPQAVAAGQGGPPRHVFVYGTLRRGEQRDITRLAPAPIFVSMSQTPGVLYHLGACAYPGVRLGGPNPVHGEVYQITPELERQLDEIESVWPQQTGEYARREINVECAGRALTCLVYEVAESRVRGLQVIESGDWLKRGPDL
jgi:gamma-glutamylcyclotransferase (GGCT)/AIG2-like uncharacterized protein YtfP